MCPDVACDPPWSAGAGVWLSPWPAPGASIYRVWVAGLVTRAHLATPPPPAAHKGKMVTRSEGWWIVWTGDGCLPDESVLGLFDDVRCQDVRIVQESCDVWLLACSKHTAHYGQMLSAYLFLVLYQIMKVLWSILFCHEWQCRHCPGQLSVRSQPRTCPASVQAVTRPRPRVIGTASQRI